MILSLGFCNRFVIHFFIFNLFLFLAGQTLALKPPRNNKQHISSGSFHSSICVTQSNRSHSSSSSISILKKFHHYPKCSIPVTNSAHNLTSKVPIWHTRFPSHPQATQPYVALAIVFNSNITQSSKVGPTYKLAMPMYYAEQHIRKSLKALLELTTGTLERYCDHVIMWLCDAVSL